MKRVVRSVFSLDSADICTRTAAFSSTEANPCDTPPCEQTRENRLKRDREADSARATKSRTKNLQNDINSVELNGKKKPVLKTVVY